MNHGMLMLYSISNPPAFAKSPVLCDPMEFRRAWPESQETPPPYPQHQHYAGVPPHLRQPTGPYYPFPTSPSFHYSHRQYWPIPSPPPKHDPYAPHGGYVVVAAATEHHYAGTGVSAAAAGGAVARIEEDPKTLAPREAIRQHGGDPLGSSVVTPLSPTLSSVFQEALLKGGNPRTPPRTEVVGLEPSMPSCLNPPDQNASKQPSPKKAKKNDLKKTTKVAQSAYCEVCKVECNSQDVLNSHKQGKKHKKNIQKLQDSITPKPAKSKTSAPAGTAGITADDDQENLQSKETKRKRTAIPDTEVVDIETKKNRVLGAGAAADGVKACTICNVVANSQKVYESHLAGQKHAAMVKRHQEGGSI